MTAGEWADEKGVDLWCECGGIQVACGGVARLVGQGTGGLRDVAL